MVKSDDLLKQYAREIVREEANLGKQCWYCGAVKRDGTCAKCGGNKDIVARELRERILRDKRFTGLLDLYGIDIDDVSLCRLGPPVGCLPYYGAPKERATVNFKRISNGHIVPYRIEISL